MAKRTWVILSLLPIYYSTFGQTPDVLYLRNETALSQVAEQVVDDYLGSDVSNADKAPYLEASIVALHNYWKHKKTQSKITPAIIAQRQEDNDKLCDNIAVAKAESDAVNKKIIELQDSLRTLELQLSSLQQESSPIHDQAISQYENLLVSDSIQWRDLQVQLAERQQTVLQQAKQEVLDRKRNLEAEEQQVAQMTTSLENYNSGSSPMARFQASVAQIEAEAKGYQPQLIGSLSDADLEGWQQMIAKMEDNASLIKSVDAAKHDALQKSIDDYKRLLPVVLGYRRAIEQMAGKYDQQENDRCAAELKKVAKTKGLTANQQNECKIVLTALQEENRSYNNLSTILSDILDVNPDINKDNFDIKSEYAGTIRLASGREMSYDPYYVTLNKVLNQLVKAFEQKSQELRNKGVKNFVEDLKAQL